MVACLPSEYRKTPAGCGVAKNFGADLRGARTHRSKLSRLHCEGTDRLLWLRARELMVAQGFRSCSLWVFPQNARAIKFYQSVGFAADPSPPKSFGLGGQQLQEVRYVCQLDGCQPTSTS